MDDFYREDLAAIHAEGFSALGAAAAQMILDALGERAASSRVLDLGCGAGALAQPLSEAGVDVWGLDLSPDLLAIARRQAPRAHFEEGSLHAAALPPADAICAIGEVVNYMADDRAGLAALGNFLDRAAGALQPGGLLLFDAAAPGRGSSRSFTEGEGWAVGSISEEADGILTRRITTFRKTAAGAWRRAEETHRLALYPPDQVLEALACAGFQAEILPGHGPLAPPPGLPVYRAVQSGGVGR